MWVDPDLNLLYNSTFDDGNLYLMGISSTLSVSDSEVSGSSISGSSISDSGEGGEFEQVADLN